MFREVGLSVQPGEAWILIEHVGSCVGRTVNTKNAMKYNFHSAAALNVSPKKASDHFRETHVDVKERPNDKAFENRRYLLKGKKEGTAGRRHDGACVQTLKNFVEPTKRDDRHYGTGRDHRGAHHDPFLLQ